MNLLDYTDVIISARQIDLAFAFYTLSRGLKGGREIREKIEAKVDYLNPYPERVGSFRELVELYDHETSPLQGLFNSNGWLVIQDNQKLPWTFEEFLHLFRRTRFRGLRILPSLLPDGKTSIEEEIVFNGIENMRFALIREQRGFTVAFYQKEYYTESRGQGYGDIDFFTRDSERIKLSYDDALSTLSEKQIQLKTGIYPLQEASFGAIEIIARFFDPDAPWPEYSLVFAPLQWNLALDLFYEKEKDLLIMEDLADDGELAIYKRVKERQEDITLSYIIVRKPKRFVMVDTYDYYKNKFFGYADLDKRQHWPKSVSATKEETYSFYAYEDSYSDKPVTDLRIIRFQGLQVNYGCYDTGSGRLSLASNQKVKSTEEFTVLSVREDNDTFYHWIRLVA